MDEEDTSGADDVSRASEGEREKAGVLDDGKAADEEIPAAASEVGAMEDRENATDVEEAAGIVVMAASELEGR